MINRRALFSDETVEYKTPFQPRLGDRVTVKLRTKKNDVQVVKTILCGRSYDMEKTATDELFDYFTMSFLCNEKAMSYHFYLSKGKEILFYNRLGASEKLDLKYDFTIFAGYYVPEWALGTVYYQIFTDRFCNGNPDNDVTDNEYFYAGVHAKKIKNWNESPKTFDVANFYGGDLQGIMSKLDYLQDLGIETLYLNPIFVSPSNHKYDTQDYDYVDPHIAVIVNDHKHAMKDDEKDNQKALEYIARVTDKENLEKSNEYFAKLVEEIHKRGMRIIIDGVFNHCGSFNRWMDREGIYASRPDLEKGAYQSADSPYRDYFKFEESAKAKSKYEGWFDIETLPKLNYEQSKALEEYILHTGQKWVSAPYNVDGWRLDVAADLGHSGEYNHRFWQKFRKAVRKANPEAVILAEHYGSAKPWLSGEEWDTVMNYDAFMEPVTWFLTGLEKHSDFEDPSKLLDGEAFVASMTKNMAIFSRASLDAAMNQLSNHDHSRFLTRTSRKAGRLASAGAESAMEGIDPALMKLAVLMQLTWPGAPALYYGDEAGQVGWTDPDNRRTYPWGNENKELLEFHKEAIALHRNIKCLRRGSVKPLSAGHGYVVYGRFDANGVAIVAINGDDHEKTLTIPVWEVGLVNYELKHVLETTSKAGGSKKVINGQLKLTLKPKSGCVYVR